MPTSNLESRLRGRQRAAGERSSKGRLDNLKCPYCSWSFTSRVARTLSCGHAFYFCENCLPDKARVRCMKCRNVTKVNKTTASGKSCMDKTEEVYACDSASLAIVNQAAKASSDSEGGSTRSSSVLSKVSNIVELSVEDKKARLKEGLYAGGSRSSSSDARSMREYYPEQIDQNSAASTRDEAPKLEVTHQGELKLSPSYQTGLEEEYQTKREYISKIRDLRKQLKIKSLDMKQKELKLMSFSDELLAEVEAGGRELSDLKLENENMSKTIKTVKLEKLLVEGKLAASLKQITNLEKDSSTALKFQEKLETLEKQISNYASLKTRNKKLEAMLLRKKDRLPCLVAKLYKGIRGFKVVISEAKTDFVRSYTSLAAYRERAFGSLVRRLKALEKIDKLTRGRYQKEQILRRRYFNEIQELKGNIRIFIRVRPMNDADRQLAGNKVIIKSKPSTNQLIVDDPRSSRKRRFWFDKVFSYEASQKEVFQNGVKEFVTSAMDGFNVSILAYGQTGSGKTYTMTGKQGGRVKDCEAGIQYRALRELFRLMRERKHSNYELTLSVLEIYNDNIRDLLGPRVVLRREADVRLKNRPSYLKIRNTEEGHMFVEDLTAIQCDTLEDVISWMKKGEANRSVGITNLNKYSSRSHSIVRITVSGRNTVASTKTNAVLSFIDLAGSERIQKSGSTGEQAKEAMYINRSLSALGNVIEALRTKQVHIPYRDSKLTYLLQEFLGGRAKVSMFINLSPMSASAEETMSSLNFAKRARATELGRSKRSRSMDSRVC